MKTKVIFKKKYDGDILAVFPEDKYSANPADNHCTCYAHIGQHSGCSPLYYIPLPEAIESEYSALKSELEQIGYNLQIIQK